jgi:hypothetical protein
VLRFDAILDELFMPKAVLEVLQVAFPPLAYVLPSGLVKAPGPANVSAAALLRDLSEAEINAVNLDLPSGAEGSVAPLADGLLKLLRGELDQPDGVLKLLRSELDQQPGEPDPIDLSARVAQEAIRLMGDQDYDGAVAVFDTALAHRWAKDVQDLRDEAARWAARNAEEAVLVDVAGAELVAGMFKRLVTCPEGVAAGELVAVILAGVEGYGVAVIPEGVEPGAQFEATVVHTDDLVEQLPQWRQHLDLAVSGALPIAEAVVVEPEGGGKPQSGPGEIPMEPVSWAEAWEEGGLQAVLASMNRVRDSPNSASSVHPVHLYRVWLLCLAVVPALPDCPVRSGHRRRDHESWPRGVARDARDCAGGVISDCHFKETTTEYDRKIGIKWLSCTAK